MWSKLGSFVLRTRILSTGRLNGNGTRRSRRMYDDSVSQPSHGESEGSAVWFRIAARRMHPTTVRRRTTRISVDLKPVVDPSLLGEQSVAAFHNSWSAAVATELVMIIAVVGSISVETNLQVEQATNCPTTDPNPVSQTV
jgi:hypothetical protein